MTDSQKKWTAFGITVFVVVLIDHITKYIVRTTPELHSKVLIEGWLELFYTQNPGMAMGISWADTWVISLVAIAASILIMVYIYKTYKQANTGYMICMGLIMGGAFGNIGDRLFMAGIKGYGGVLDGHVVDFIHFSLRINDWAVFPYIFNMADAAISVAIIVLLIFHKRLLPEYAQSEKSESEVDEPVVSESDIADTHK